ncbi:MAG: hypothetical protein SF123_26585 [Chloroflexota bacterium]|nr:hypothetical protein [Chloroflexota bacterium]
MLARRLQRLIHTGGSAPNLVVAQRVIDKMMAAAHAFMEDETGEAMVGLVVPPSLPNGVPTLYVLDTISPDASAVRHFHTFQQGDDRQDELIWWLQENWRLRREKAQNGGSIARFLGVMNDKWDVPLSYLGDWHKQPGFMIQPSGGDLMTAIEWISDPENNTEFLLAPIVTIGHPATIEGYESIGNFILVPQGGGESLRVDFWYIDYQTRMFVPVIPAVYPNDQLPELVAYPWHLADEKLLDAELTALNEDGLYVFSTLTLYDADGTLPMEICLVAGRNGSDKLLIVVTPYDYPKSAPSIRVAPFTPMSDLADSYKVFERIWQTSTPLDVPYEPGKHLRLLDYIRAAEAKLGIMKPAPQSPTTHVDVGTRHASSDVAASSESTASDNPTRTPQSEASLRDEASLQTPSSAPDAEPAMTDDAPKTETPA